MPLQWCWRAPWGGSSWGSEAMRTPSMGFNTTSPAKQDRVLWKEYWQTHLVLFMLYLTQKGNPSTNSWFIPTLKLTRRMLYDTFHPNWWLCFHWLEQVNFLYPGNIRKPWYICNMSSEFSLFFFFFEDCDIVGVVDICIIWVHREGAYPVAISVLLMLTSPLIPSVSQHLDVDIMVLLLYLQQQQDWGRWMYHFLSQQTYQVQNEQH